MRIADSFERACARVLWLMAFSVLTIKNAPADEPSAAFAHRIVVGGIERHYLLFAPSLQDSEQKLPLLFVFHGANNDGALMDRMSGFTQLAEKKQFMVVYPDGLNKRWNSLNLPTRSGNISKTDDVAFISALIDDLESHYRIDPKRIYATGSSNGAIFCHTLAARLSSRIAAIGPVSGNIVELIPQRLTPDCPVSVVLFNGTDDPILPFSGEPSKNGTGLRSVSGTIAFWVGIDQCGPSRQLLLYPEPSLMTALPFSESTILKREARRRLSRILLIMGVTLGQELIPTRFGRRQREKRRWQSMRLKLCGPFLRLIRKRSGTLRQLFNLARFESGQIRYQTVQAPGVTLQHSQM